MITYLFYQLMPDWIQLKPQNFIKRLANTVLHRQVLRVKLYNKNCLREILIEVLQGAIFPTNECVLSISTKKNIVISDKTHSRVGPLQLFQTAVNQIKSCRLNSQH